MISISIAVTKATKLPTVTPLLLLCHSATAITAERAAEASNWVSGVMAAMATVDLSASRRSATLSTSKRSVWRAWAPCSRTMRWARAFSSTT
ncbi:hypothetical protein D9M68_874780 [compost metagenome]